MSHDGIHRRADVNVVHFDPAAPISWSATAVLPRLNRALLRHRFRATPHTNIAITPSLQRRLEAVGIQARPSDWLTATCTKASVLKQDRKPATPPPELKLCFVAGGRLVEKGLRDAIEVCELLATSLPATPIHLSIVGRADRRAKAVLRNMARQTIVNLTGTLSSDNVLSLMDCHQILLVCTPYESYSFVAAQAIQCNTTVVHGGPVGLMDLLGKEPNLLKMLQVAQAGHGTLTAWLKNERTVQRSKFQTLIDEANQSSQSLDIQGFPHASA